MKEFEILCVTMHQSDFSKVQEMNIHSNVVFANQTDNTSYSQIEINGKLARMISTTTRGVGVNRNIALAYAECNICLFADDDVKYVNEVERIVLKEFSAHPEADVIVFNIKGDDPNRKQKEYKKTRKVTVWENKPWGAVRIAARMDSIKKANIWFSTLFGGGCKYPSGEDSLWIVDAMKKGLCFYVSKETIGSVSFQESSWFSGMNEEFFFGKGAYYEVAHPRTKYIWVLYFAFRTKGRSKISFFRRIAWIKKGMYAVDKGLSYKEIEGDII